MNKLGIHFGALADNIGKQLKFQKLKFDPKVTKMFDKSANCITQLWFDGILSDSQKKSCQDKLFKKIITHVNKLNTAPKDK